MTPIKHPKMTRDLDPPAGWESACEPLAVVDTIYGMMSFWKPSWLDRVRILLGRPVRLTVSGFGHPPVSLDTETLE